MGFDTKTNDSRVLGQIEQLEDIIRINNIDELIFCSQDIQASSIIESMLLAANPSTEFKIAPPESVSVIGSNSIHTTGDLYVIDLNSLSKGVNKRKKRLFDIVFGIVILVLSPLLLIVVHSPKGIFKNAVFVIIGRLTWVGIILERHQYAEHDEIKKGVLTPDDGLQKKSLTDSVKQRLSIMYAKDYKVANDLMIVLRSFRLLGRSS